MVPFSMECATCDLLGARRLIGRLGVLISIEGRESRNDAPAQLREPHHRADPDDVG
jgi:hypothetical protein